VRFSRRLPAGHKTHPTQQIWKPVSKSQFLMLRGMWDGDRLAFTARENLFRSAEGRSSH